MSENDLQVRAQRRIGTVLCGKYRVDRVLGVGGMAVVYAATHRNQKRVALKMLHPEFAMHEELRARFLREGYAANTVDHPGAVAVLDDDTAEDGAAFLVMERLEGEEVDRLWEQRGRRLPVEAVLSIASQLLDVLVAAHAKAIVHRDIKPANLYITTYGTLKVLDFGIARLRDAASAGHAATGTGMMLGTPAFMAPEQALGKSREIDGTTDDWSAGATMFTLLSGRFVHEGETSTELVVKSATQPARSLATVAPEVDPRVVEIVDRALAFEKSTRWPSAAAMRDAVRATYAAIYGSKVGKEPLERLLAQTSDWMGQTLPVDAVPYLAPPPHTPAPAGSRLEPTRDMTAYPSASAVRAPAPHSPTREMSMASMDRPSAWASGAMPPRVSVGGSTARPVEAAAASLPQGVPRPTPIALIVGIVAVATLVAVLGIGWMMISRGPSSAASAPPRTAPPATAPPAAEPAPLPTAPTLPALVAADAAPSVAETSPTPRSAPSIATAVPVAPHPPASASSPAPPRAVSPPNCDPPFTIDRSGHRVPKPECI